ncbi:MAG TPA: septal ring lytic transglycosylase RlpA family protein [Solirubrobacteraceae bacterium]|nr:septal ring lytic transglycosylase RlpA family protein [Solirubrobacteraceae bacterium]
MIAPAPPAQPALALAPVEIAQATTLAQATTPSPTLSLGRPTTTALHVHRARLNVLADRRVSIAGTLSPGLSDRPIQLQAMGPHGWRQIAHTRTGAAGRFRLRYVPPETGSRRVRLRFPGDGLDLAAHRLLGRLNVYRLAEASWYGGGGSLACGGSLTSGTLGVANKTLPCGTLVTLRYGSRSVRVPVVDRGPYVAGREFDLTEATKQRLGFGDTGEVWTTR